jgi:hypothetical protein
MSDRAASTIPPSTNELEQIRYALDQSAIVAITDVPGRITYATTSSVRSRVRARSCSGRPPHPEFRLSQQGVHPGPVADDRARPDLARRAAQPGQGRVDLLGDTTIVPFLDEHGKPWQYPAIRYDITERKRQSSGCASRRR